MALADRVSQTQGLDEVIEDEGGLEAVVAALKVSACCATAIPPHDAIPTSRCTCSTLRRTLQSPLTRAECCAPSRAPQVVPPSKWTD